MADRFHRPEEEPRIHSSKQELPIPHSVSISRSIVHETINRAVTFSQSQPSNQPLTEPDLFANTAQGVLDSSSTSYDTATGDSSFEEDKDPHSAYRSQKAFLGPILNLTMAPPPVAVLGNHTDATFKGFDLQIPNIPKCPYVLKDNEQDGPVPTVKQQHIERLQLLYGQYLTNKGAVESLEAPDRANPTARSDDLQRTISELRSSIAHTYSQIAPLQKKIDHIKGVQVSLRPSLEVPVREHSAQDQGSHMIKDARDFIGKLDSIDDPEERLIEMWSKLLVFAQINDIGRIDFKKAVFAILKGDHYRFIRNYPAMPIEKLAPLIASRFISESRFNDAVSDLDNFKREKGEALRFSVERLRTSLEKAAVLWPSNQRDTIKDFEIRKTIRLIVSEKTRRLLDKETIAARQQGLTISLDKMIRIAEDEERSTGIHNEPEIRAPISLYQTSVELDPISQKLDTLTDLMIKMSVQTLEARDSVASLATEEDEAECNAALRSPARFGTARQSTRPYGLNRAPSTVAKPATTASYISPSASPVRAPAPRPATPFAAPSSDVHMRSGNSSASTRFQSVDRSARPTYEETRARDRDRSRSAVRDRQRDSRDNTYDRSRSRSTSQPDKNYQGRSSSTESQYNRDTSRYPRYDNNRRSDNRPLSPNARNIRNSSPSYGLNYRDIKPHRQSGDRQSRETSRERDYQHRRQYQNRNEGRSSNYRNASPQGYQNNHRYSQDYDNSRYDRYDRNRSASRNRYQQYQHNPPNPVVNANDTAVVNVGLKQNGICQLCRSTFEHSVKDCYVVRAALQQENN